MSILKTLVPKTKPESTQAVSFRLSAEDKAVLQRACQLKGCTISALMVAVIQDLKQELAQYDASNEGIEPTDEDEELQNAS